MARKVFLGLLAAAALAWAGPSARSQDNLLEEMYGRGVHAYFARHYREAHENLSAAIVAGSRDPRAYYFRGLANSKLGRPDEAKADFAQGASLEVAGGEPIPVGRSLERVQGVDRVAIESSRRMARLEAHTKQLSQDRVRIEPTRNAEEIRDPTRTAPVAPAAVEAADPTDPFGPGTAAPATLPVPIDPRPTVPAPAPAPAAA